MAHPKKEDTGILGILQASSVNGDDVVKGLLRHTIQQLLEEELTAFLNAEPYDRTESRRGYRNGYKPRTLTTRVGRLELMVPKDREGRFSVIREVPAQRESAGAIDYGDVRAGRIDPQSEKDY